MVLFKDKCMKEVYIRARKGIILGISNEDMDDIIDIIKSLESSDVLIDGVSKTVKHEIKKTIC